MVETTGADAARPDLRIGTIMTLSIFMKRIGAAARAGSKSLPVPSWASFGAAAFALPLAWSGAQAVVGGATDGGTLAGSSVMVLNSRGGMCSAVVVARDVVLTAAHCVAGGDDHRIHFKDERGQPVLIEPAAKAVHPGFDAKAIAARRRSIDLALVRTPGPLPDRFTTAALTGATPSRDAGLVVGGWGAAQERDFRTTGTFRTASLRVVEPYGPSTILVWAEGAPGTGACEGDSGGPLTETREGTRPVFAVTTWATGPKGRACGALTQGVLLGPQRAWIDKTLAGWGRSATWE